MATSSPAAVRHLRRAATLCDDGLSDAQLLDGFLACRDEAAFEALVRRHGPMVLGVCRRVVGNATDADDAFQATFLVLVRRAAAVTNRDLLGNWLYGVAFRTALEARSRMLRRRAKELPVDDFPDPATEPDETSPELLALLDRELNRLPEKYRVPVVLCELEGASRKTVAKRLGIPEGTLSSRLAAARRLLADRLTRRGVTVGVAAVATALSQTDAPAMVPAPLIGSTVRAALDFAAGASVSAPVAALTQGVIQSMFLTKLKLTAVLVTTIGMAVATLTYGVVSYQPATAAPQKADGDKPKPKGGQKSDKDLLQGGWKVVDVKAEGDKPGGAKSMTFFFAKDKAFLGQAGPPSMECGLTIDPTSKPKQITLLVPGDKRNLMGIYKFDGEKLMLSFGMEQGAERPSDFDGKGKSFVFELERDPTAKNPVADPKAFEKVKIAAARMKSANNMKQILLALHNYHDVNGAMPAAAITDKNGKPLLSWRVSILPYIEQNVLYQKFKLDEPWDSDHNKKLIVQMPKIYGDKAPKSNYRVFTGKGTAFEGTKGLKLSDFTDGTSNTMIIVEAADGVEWTKPEEFEYDAKTPLPKLGGTPFENGYQVGMADGSVRFMSIKAKEATMRAIITRNGGEVIENNNEEEE